MCSFMPLFVVICYSSNKKLNTLFPSTSLFILILVDPWDFHLNLTSSEKEISLLLPLWPQIHQRNAPFSQLLYFSFVALNTDRLFDYCLCNALPLQITTSMRTESMLIFFTIIFPIFHNIISQELNKVV